MPSNHGSGPSNEATMKNSANQIIQELDILVLDYLESGGDPLQMADILTELANKLIHLETLHNKATIN